MNYLTKLLIDLLMITSLLWLFLGGLTGIIFYIKLLKSSETDKRKRYIKIILICFMGIPLWFIGFIITAISQPNGLL
jgi:hypothetical protein